MTAPAHPNSARRALLRRRLPLVLAGFFAATLVAGFAFSRTLLCVEAGPGPRHAEVIVVLGGETVHRVGRALDLFQHGAAPRILVSGAGDSDLIRDQLVRSGVPGDAVAIEDRCEQIGVSGNESCLSPSDSLG